jgi:murein DD-endopeptidase MepM/ murein hydrolase activator NlpD
LPFMGEWTVSQGYDGSITHKGDWSKALDFVVLDEQMKTFRLPGNLPEHFYCYNMPVLSPGDGIVEEIVDHIEDNPIGGNNTTQNWGNSIVIKHVDGLYSKLSHLKKNSFKVSKGMYVKKRDVLATCGNSGRSPEPHLHFQIQSTPYIGSKTLEYPFAAFLTNTNKTYQPQLFTVPSEGTKVCNVLPDAQLQEAFNFQPGYFFTISAEGFETEEWEAATNIYNETYICCKKNQTTAYFIKNDTQFYFTQYYGSKKSLLFYFYQAAYSVLLSTDKSTTLKDQLPLTILPKSPIQWLQDSIAPFYIFRQLQFEGTMQANTDPLGGGKIAFGSIIKRKLGLKKTKHLETSIHIEKGKIQSFTIHLSNKTIEVKCHY